MAFSVPSMATISKSPETTLDYKTLQSIAKSLQQLEVFYNIEKLMLLSTRIILIKIVLTKLMGMTCSLQHPYVYPSEAIEFHEAGIITIKKFSSKGSLRDILGSSKVI